MVVACVPVDQKKCTPHKQGFCDLCSVLRVIIVVRVCSLQVQVSIRRIQYEKAWAKVEEMQAEDVVFEGPIIAVNRGGAIVLVEVRLPCYYSVDCCVTANIHLGSWAHCTIFTRCVRRRDAQAPVLALVSRLVQFFASSKLGAAWFPAWIAHVRWSPYRGCGWKDDEVQVPRGELLCGWKESK